jgi:Mg2+/citrate symporter
MGMTVTDFFVVLATAIVAVPVVIAMSTAMWMARADHARGARTDGTDQQDESKQTHVGWSHDRRDWSQHSRTFVRRRRGQAR